MKTNVILTMLLAMVLGSCTISVSSEAKEGIVPSKNYITQKVKVDNFDGISTSTSINVVYTQTTGDTDVEIYAPDNLMEYVKVQVDGGILKIGFQSDEKGKGINIRGKHKTEVRVAAPAVHALQASSSGDIILKNGLTNTGKVSIKTSSSGDIKGGNVVCEALVIDASSSGDIELEKVECTSLVTEANSAGDISIKSLKAESVDVKASSSGDVSIAGVCRSAKFDASSAGDIEADELKADEVIAKASSSGDVTCYASEKLEVSISSAGNVGYKGNPKQILNHSKGLKKMD
ncbi:MAG: DUF2807 domain-containing protein [Bacteroidaceae bacterium]|nr:DUF2807 domain-containing protein [Bacteroidaceae bacterium]